MFNYRYHNSPPPTPTLNHISQFHTPISYHLISSHLRLRFRRQHCPSGFMFLLAYLMFLDLKHAQLLATCWTVRGSNTGGGEIFRTRPDGPWGPPSLLCNGYRVFPTVKRPRRGVDHPTPSSAEVKERVQLDLFCPSGPSWPVLG